MATHKEWANGYARQADADLKTYEVLCSIDSVLVPACHKLQFLQMACEKVTKAHLCNSGTNPTTIQKSHAYIEKSLPAVLRDEAYSLKLKDSTVRQTLMHARHLAKEIEALAPAVKRGGKRPDNCEYPWEDGKGHLHVPLDWTFSPAQFIKHPSGITILKLIRRAIDRLMQ